jgi:HK97 family phage prohead protease
MRAATDSYERRRAARDAQLDAFDGRIIRGTPIVFEALSLDLGGFQERILPSAVDRTLREGLDVRALVDHDTSKIIGRTKAGTLSLRKERDGLSARIEPPNTSVARDLVESIGRGDISGMSFGFRVLDDDWHMEDGIPIREILDMVIREISIVSFPAYEDTNVEIAKRSLELFRQSSGWKPSIGFLERVARAVKR